MSNIDAHIFGSLTYAKEVLGLPEDEATTYAQTALNAKRWQVAQMAGSADPATVDRTLESLLAGGYEFPQA